MLREYVLALSYHIPVLLAEDKIREAKEATDLFIVLGREWAEELIEGNLRHRDGVSQS
jgi:hypothetical protein